MIQHPYAKQLTSLDKPLCDPDIVGAGIENTTGMVVSNNDRCGTFSERIREDLNLKYEKDICGISFEVQQIFLRHSWPGNIQELKNCLERAVIFCEGEEIQISDLPMQYHQHQVFSEEKAPIKDLYDSISREIILSTLEKTEGNKSKTAEILKISRKTLYQRMKKLEIDL